MLGLNSSLRRYSCIRRTKTQNASSSGIWEEVRRVSTVFTYKLDTAYAANLRRQLNCIFQNLAI